MKMRMRAANVAASLPFKDMFLVDIDEFLLTTVYTARGWARETHDRRDV
jgi:hypothetical protein